MNIWDGIVLALVALCAGLAFRHIRKNQKAGCTGCCSGCACACACNAQEKKAS